MDKIHGLNIIVSGIATLRVSEGEREPTGQFTVLDFSCLKCNSHFKLEKPMIIWCGVSKLYCSSSECENSEVFIKDNILKSKN
jgi:hypothetical protein